DRWNAGAGDCRFRSRQGDDAGSDQRQRPYHEHELHLQLQIPGPSLRRRQVERKQASACVREFFPPFPALNNLRKKYFLYHSPTSAAKADFENTAFIAAVNRCATQNQVQHRVSPQAVKRWAKLV